MKNNTLPEWSKTVHHMMVHFEVLPVYNTLKAFSGYSTEKLTILMPTAKEQALVILSGGQDSTTCLYWAMEQFGQQQVQAITFDYQQRHHVELEAARAISQFAGIPHHILPINTFAALGGNALTDDIDVAAAAPDCLPNTFVPGRNLIFLTYAAAFAYQKKIKHLVTGVAQTDYSGYPDCRQKTLAALQQTINLAMEADFKIHTPLMFLTKKQTVEMAVQNGAIHALHLSHSCYNGVRPGCGQCPACLLRAKGFAQAGITDPLFSSCGNQLE